MQSLVFGLPFDLPWKLMDQDVKPKSKCQQLEHRVPPQLPKPEGTDEGGVESSQLRKTQREKLDRTQVTSSAADGSPKEGEVAHDTVNASQTAMSAAHCWPRMKICNAQKPKPE